MQIVVTGGAGFIGCHLVEYLLKKKHNVTIIDNLSTGRIENIKEFASKISFIKSDISKKGKWTKAFKKADVVYHLAALADIVPSIQNPNKYFEANVIGTKNIVETAIKYKVKKIIYAASSSCYGIPKKYPTDESSKNDPKYPYALTKLLGESILLHYGKVYGVKILSLRLFNVYGTKSRTSGTYGAMFGVFLKQKIANQPLTVVGSGNQKRDFTYVTDVVNAFYKGLYYSCNINILNVGTGKPISINKIVKLLNSKKVTIPKRPGEPDITNAKISKIKREMKWVAKIKIKEGINLLLNDINYWSKAPLWNQKKIKLATKDWFKYLK
jgi:UDP-glucose 4-epimerase